MNKCHECDKHELYYYPPMRGWCCPKCGLQYIMQGNDGLIIGKDWPAPSSYECYSYKAGDAVDALLDGMGIKHR